MKNLSIKYKIFLFFSILLIIILITLTIVIHSISKSTLIQKTIQSSSQELHIVANSLDARLEHIIDYSITMSVDSRIIEILQNNPQAFPNNSIEFFELKSIATAIIAKNEDISMWDILSVQNEPLTLGGYDINDYKLLMPTLGLLSSVETGEAEICGPYQISYNFTDGPQNYFLLFKPIFKSTRLERIGTVVFLINETSLASTFVDNISQQFSQFYIINDEGSIISSSDKSSINIPFTEQLNLSEKLLYDLNEDGQLLIEDGHVPVLYNMVSCDHFNWKVINVSELQIVQQEENQISKTIMIFGISALILALAISFYFSRSISQPISYLANIMQNSPADSLNLPTNLKIPSGETGILYMGFNQLMHRLQQLIKDVRTEQEEKSNYQFQLIQSQINPHFLYNTLGTIHSLIDLNEKELAQQALLAMSDFYRLSLSGGDSIITLKEEIQLCKQYMLLQSLRYKEYVEFEFEIDPRIDSYLIPKMSIQPILENAIYHGLKPQRKKGNIKIRGTIDGKHILIDVWDNGSGISEKQLLSLKEKLISTGNFHSSSNDKHSSFGLLSINRRIQLFYGTSYGIDIVSIQGEFTQVRLVLPYQKEAKTNEKNSNH